MLQAELRVVGGKHHGKVIPLSKQKFLIGRESDCQLRPNSELVSRHHCVFTVDQFSVRLRDLGSTNGTFINGEQIQGVSNLESGNKVSIGKLEFEVVIKEVPDVAGAPGMQPPEPESVTEQLSQSSTSTEFELPIQAYPDQVAPDDTAIIQGSQPSTPQPIIPPGSMPQQPGFHQPPAAPYPQMPGYQTPPGGFPQQQPMGYPPQQQPMGYPPQQQPMGYPPQQQPMGYPPQQQPMGYPPQQQQAPPTPAPAAEPEESLPEETSSVGEVEAPPIQLPHPSTTGATAKVEAPPAKEGEEEKEPESNPSTTAADIIQQRLKPKPGGIGDDN